MAGVTLILQLHQPYVLSKYDALSPGPIIDLAATRRACQRFAARSIERMNQVLTEVAVELGGRFRVTCLVSGLALEIFARFQPGVIASLKRLADAGVMDFAVTPYHYGLSCLVDADEFLRQVDDARAAVREHFDRDATTMANTAMLYNDWIGELVSPRGISTVICNLPPNDSEEPGDNVYAGVLLGPNGTDLVMCDSWMSRQFANRFCAVDDANGPLTAPNFAAMLAERAAAGGHRTLIWDYQTFGDTLAADTGVFAFLRHLPGQLLQHGFERFQYCCDATAASADERANGVIQGQIPKDFRPSQYEGVSVDGSSALELLGDPMISHAHARLYSLKDSVLCSGSEELIQDWRRMQAWDYPRSMGATETRSVGRWCINGSKSGYEGYVIFMGHCDKLASGIDASRGPGDIK